MRRLLAVFRDWTAIEWAMAVAIAAILAAVIGGAIYEKAHPCLRSHIEHNQLLYSQIIGKVIIPVYGDAAVCDQRAP